MATSPKSRQTPDLLTCLLGALPANPFRSPAKEEEWMTRVVTWRSNIWNLLKGYAPAGWYGKTSPEFCQVTAEKISPPYLGGWRSAGMGGPTEALTLNLPVWHSGASVCSLLQVLEAGNVPQRYFLSVKACAGILRRAEKRGKKLPAQLQQALQAVVVAEVTPQKEQW